METSSPGTQVTTVTITGSIDPAGHGADEPTTTVEHNREVGKGDEAAVALLQTRQQHQTFHRMVVVPSNTGRQSALSNKSATSSPSADATSFTLSNDPNSTEYYEFSETTLKRFYGDVTPYGTWAKGESRASLTVPRQEDKKRSLLTSGYDTGTNPRHRSAPVSPIQQSPSASLPTSVYSTLLRPKSSRVQEVLLEDSTITYVDFLPDKVKTRYTRNEYKSFGDCVDKANAWLNQHGTVRLIRCETVKHRLDHQHFINTESSTSHDRSWLVGLRIWLFQPESEGRKGRQITIGYDNFIPNYKNSDRTNWKARDTPLFEELPQTLQRINEKISTSSLPGKLLTVESICTNYTTVYRDDGNLNVDNSYYCLDLQGKWDFWFIRLFYLKNVAPIPDLCVDAHDVIPAPISVPPSKVHFQSVDTLITNASQWLSGNDLKDVVSLQVVELPFKPKHLEKSQECVNTCQMHHASKKYSVRRDTIRILRIWLRRKHFERNRAPASSLRPCLQVRTFVPTQLTTPGCCGIQRAIFATTQDTVKRIAEWQRLTGVEIVDIQTDNVEKWSSSPRLVEERSLSERCYNKEDYKSPCARSGLEYRLNVYRVYYRPTALTEADASSPVKPVEPCCCFVGCCVM